MLTMEDNKTIDQVQTKHCSSCFRILPVQCFAFNPQTKSGLNPMCNECRRDRVLRSLRKKYTPKNPHKELTIIHSLSDQNSYCISLAANRSPITLCGLSVRDSFPIYAMEITTTLGRYRAVLKNSQNETLLDHLQVSSLDDFKRDLMALLRSRFIRLEVDLEAVQYTKLIFFGQEPKK